MWTLQVIPWHVCCLRMRYVAIYFLFEYSLQQTLVDLMWIVIQVKSMEARTVGSGCLGSVPVRGFSKLSSRCMSHMCPMRCFRVGLSLGLGLITE
jgi:hypothetical protein